MKTVGYIIQLPDESLLAAVAHYANGGLNTSKKEAVKEWKESIKLGLVSKRSKPNILKIEIKGKKCR